MDIESKKLPPETNPPPVDRLYRSETDKIIAGVAGGIGVYFKIDPTIVRIIFILLTVFGGSGLLVYLLLWLIVPAASGPSPDVNDVSSQNSAELKNRAGEFAQNSSHAGQKDDRRVVWGIFLFAAGVVFLLNNFGFFDLIRFSRLWPLILVIAGAFLLTRSHN